jgi:hypothetical protein
LRQLQVHLIDPTTNRQVMTEKMSKDKTSSDKTP